MTKFEYKFVKLDYTRFGKPIGDYHNVIAKHGSEGWRLVQILAIGSNMPSELTFERPIKDEKGTNEKANGR
jgi:hypothetical protein